VPESAEITRAVDRGLMRSSDVAAFLGVSRQRVDQMVEMDGLPAPRLVAGHRMWDRTEVETWADRALVGYATVAVAKHLAPALLGSEPRSVRKRGRTAESVS
jgi:predicted DNA-binding transcriptional regulator AlpA